MIVNLRRADIVMSGEFAGSAVCTHGGRQERRTVWGWQGCVLRNEAAGHDLAATPLAGNLSGVGEAATKLAELEAPSSLAPQRTLGAPQTHHALQNSA
jgi:hypothetical protein